MIVDYNNTSRALKVKHIYCLASILDCVKSLVIKQEKVKPTEKAFLQVLMNKYNYIKLTIPREKYVNWISAYDLIANDRKFHVHLSVFPEICFDDNVDDNFAFHENEEDIENQPVSIGKRALDLIETPPEIKKQKIMLTESVKRIMFDTQSSKLKLKTDSVTFPYSLNKFLNPFDIYNEFNEALTWDDRSTYDHKEVIETKVFKPVDERFVHSILTYTDMKHWLLLTEVGIFLPNRKDIDSCSYDLESTELSEFSIKISKDKNQGRGYSELTIQAGCFQILATGGIYGNQDTLLGGFLGSSIPSNSIHEYNTCYTLH